MNDVIDFPEREAQVAEATGVKRAELEQLGFRDVEPTRPDISSDGWVIRASLTNKKLEPFTAYPAGTHVVITGRAS